MEASLVLMIILAKVLVSLEGVHLFGYSSCDGYSMSFGSSRFTTAPGNVMVMGTLLIFRECPNHRAIVPSSQSVPPIRVVHP